MNKKITIIKHLSSEQALLAFSSEFATIMTTGMVIYLHGPLGAGKTTFVRGLLSALGHHGKVKSPTYTLVEPYQVAGRQIYHFDFYRLNGPLALESIGINDYFLPDAICIIEWPEKGFPLLPAPDVNCYITYAGLGRTMRIDAETAQGEGLLQILMR